jgi:Bacteriophage Mu Gam like protein
MTIKQGDVEKGGEAIQACSDYQRLVTALERFSRASAAASGVQALVDTALMGLIEKHRDAHAELASAATAAEEEVKGIARAHPEWADGRTIKTPFGSVQFRRTSKLVVRDEEATLRKIEENKIELAPEEFIRVEKHPNLEALEALDDGQLRKLGVVRETSDAIVVKPAKVELGKPRSQAAAEPAKN